MPFTTPVSTPYHSAGETEIAADGGKLRGLAQKGAARLKEARSNHSRVFSEKTWKSQCFEIAGNKEGHSLKPNFKRFWIGDDRDINLFILFFNLLQGEHGLATQRNKHVCLGIPIEKVL